MAAGVCLAGAAWGALEAMTLFAFRYAPWQARNPLTLPSLLAAGILSYGVFGLAAGVTGAMIWACCRPWLAPKPRPFAAGWSVLSLLVALGSHIHVTGSLKDTGHTSPLALWLSVGILVVAAAAGFSVYRLLSARTRDSLETRLPEFRGRRRLAAMVPCAALVLGGEARALLGTAAPELKDPVAETLAHGVVASRGDRTITTNAAGLPNVLMISVDTLRADHLNSWGYRARPVSPTLDRLAAEGVRFENAFAQASWTRPSMASLLTSLYPRQHRQQRPTSMLPTDVLTLPERLASLGYRTAYFCANPTLAFDPGYRFHEAYVQFSPQDPYYVSPFFPSPFLIGPLFDFVFYRRLRVVSVEGMPEIFIDADQVNQAAGRWLKTAPSPFFLHLHYMEPHWPYFEHPYHAIQWDPRTAWNRDQLVRRYDGEIRFVDQKIAELLSEIDSNGLGRNLLVIVTADHGEEFLDHNGWEHSQTLYREVLHVPLILRWPGKLPYGSVVDQPVELVDVAPTVVELIGEKPTTTWAGRSLVPLIHGEPQPSRPILGSLVIAKRGRIGWMDSLQEDGMKLVVSRREGAPVRRLLFDVARDPAEKTDIGGIHQEQVKEMESKLNAILARLETTRLPEQDRSLTPEQTEQLKALGYVQ